MNRKIVLNPKDARRYNFQDAPMSMAYQGKDTPAWQERARAQFISLLGMPKEKPAADEFTVEWKREHAANTETRFYFKSEPHVWALAHLMIPRGLREPPPLVVCLQGHSTGMHISLGRAKWEKDEAAITDGENDYALQCLNRGMAALVIEQRGFGENGGRAEDGAPSCRDGLAYSALLVGRTLAGERVWDVMRCIDAAVAHLDGFDPNRIAVQGVSGGGTTCLYAAIADPRIAAALPACCFSSYAASIGLITHCPCNYIPHLMEYFDMGDLAGLIAPRPLALVNGRKDGIFPLSGAVEQFRRTQQIYKDLGAEDKCVHLVGEGGHRFYAAASWDAFFQVTQWRGPGG